MSSLFSAGRGEAPAYDAQTLDERWKFGRAIRLTRALADQINERKRSAAEPPPGAARGRVYLIVNWSYSEHGEFGVRAVRCQRERDPRADHEKDLAFRYANSYASSPELGSFPQYIFPGDRVCPLIRHHAEKAPRLHAALWYEASLHIFTYLPGVTEELLPHLWPEHFQGVRDDDVGGT